MEQASLDLRQNLRLDIFLNNGITYYPSIENIPQIDSYYSIEFDNISFNTNNNGLTINGNSIIWELNTNLFGIGLFEGVLRSQSTVIGKYLNIKIKLHIE